VSAERDPGTVRDLAAAGVASTGESLPYLEPIQRSFGAHDVAQVQAHVGGAAADAAGAIGAEAYATGDHVAFATPPDLHTAAHEAAHVVQQASGVQLLGGVGSVGDAHERQADAVADAVVAGRSAEPILEGLPGGQSVAGVQRKGLAVPNTSREVEVVIERGAASFAVKVVTTMGESAAAGGETENVGPLDEASWSVLEPKMVTEANSFGLRLEAALIKSEFSLELFEGVDLSLELTGPEGSFDLENGGDLSLAQIEIKAVADLVVLGGLRAPPGTSFKVEVSGSFTIGGKLLAKLADMAARAEIIAGKADELGKIADDLAKAQSLDEELARQRKALLAQRDALPDDWSARDARRELDGKLRDLDARIGDNRATIHASAARSGALQRELAEDARKLTAIERKLDGKIAKKLAGRISKAAARKIARAVGKLLPVLNLVSTIADIVSVIELFAEWADHDFDLPVAGSGDPLTGVVSWEEEQQGDGAGAEDDADAAGAGDVDVGAHVDEDAGDGSRSDDHEERAEPRSSRSKRKGEAGGDVPVSVPDQIHRRAKAVLEVIERKGVRLDEAQVRALEHIVPSTLTDDQAVELVEALILQGPGLAANQDAHDVLAAVEQAVRDLQETATRVKVDGKERADLSSKVGGVASKEEEGAGGRDPGGGPSEDRPAPESYDLREIVEKLPESVVESWLSFRRGLQAEGFDAWREANIGASVPGEPGLSIDNASIDITRGSEDVRWALEVTFDLRTQERRRTISHHFFVDRDDDGQPVAERIIMFTVRP